MELLALCPPRGALGPGEYHQASERGAQGMRTVADLEAEGWIKAWPDPRYQGAWMMWRAT